MIIRNLDLTDSVIRQELQQQILGQATNTSSTTNNRTRNNSRNTNLSLTLYNCHTRNDATCFDFLTTTLRPTTARPEKDGDAATHREDDAGVVVSGATEEDHRNDEERETTTTTVRSKRRPPAAAIITITELILERCQLDRQGCTGLGRVLKSTTPNTTMTTTTKTKQHNGTASTCTETDTAASQPPPQLQPPPPPQLQLQLKSFQLVNVAFLLDDNNTNSNGHTCGSCYEPLLDGLQVAASVPRPSAASASSVPLPFEKEKEDENVEDEERYNDHAVSVSVSDGVAGDSSFFSPSVVVLESVKLQRIRILAPTTAVQSHPSPLPLYSHTTVFLHHLLRTLKHCTTLRSLHLVDCNIGGQNEAKTTNNGCTEEMIALGQVIRALTVTRPTTPVSPTTPPLSSLSSSSSSSSIIRTNSHTLATTNKKNLTMLDLSRNNIDGNGIHRFLVQLQQQTQPPHEQHPVLSSSSSTAVSFSSTTTTSSLQRLVLSHNPLGDDGVASIAQYLQQRSSSALVALHLVDCDIWSPGYTTLLTTGLLRRRGGHSLQELMVDNQEELELHPQLLDTLVQGLQTGANVTLQQFVVLGRRSSDSNSDNSSSSSSSTGSSDYYSDFESDSDDIHTRNRRHRGSHRQRLLQQQWKTIDYYLHLNRGKLRRLSMDETFSFTLWPYTRNTGRAGQPKTTKTKTTTSRNSVMTVKAKTSPSSADIWFDALRRRPELFNSPQKET